MRITLCGSTRFEPLFHDWNHKLACAGHTVYSLSLFGREAKDAGKDDKKTVTEDEKITLDLVHFDKILNSDAIVVINQDGYVGFSTAREIRWARMHSKRVYWHFQNHPSEPYAGDLLQGLRDDQHKI
jgi:dienelactone hydrolase